MDHAEDIQLRTEQGEGHNCDSVPTRYALTKTRARQIELTGALVLVYGLAHDVDRVPHSAGTRL